METYLIARIANRSALALMSDGGWDNSRDVFSAPHFFYQGYTLLDVHQFILQRDSAFQNLNKLILRVTPNKYTAIIQLSSDMSEVQILSKYNLRSAAAVWFIQLCPHGKKADHQIAFLLLKD